MIKNLKKEIEKITEQIKTMAKEDKTTKLLMTIPGVGYYLALLIAAEIGDIKRFQTSKNLVSAAGLAVSTRASGGVVYHGRITKQGSKWLRWAMVEATIHAVRQKGHIKDFYERIRYKKGNKIARVASARKLLTYVYYMLKEEKPYEEIIKKANISCFFLVYEIRPSK